VQCTTTKGPFDIAVYENWSPHGTPRFIELVETGFFHSKVGFVTTKNLMRPEHEMHSTSSCFSLSTLAAGLPIRFSFYVVKEKEAREILA